jgi:hypothetical protein
LQTPASVATTFLQIARDPNLIPFVYDYCEQWCRYCPVTARCLYFRTRQARWRAALAGRDTETVDACSPFAHVIADARAMFELTSSPVAELDLDLVDERRVPGPPALGDPLEQLGRQYLMLANRYFVTSGMDICRDADGWETSPAHVAVWFHLIIAPKIFRALVSAERTRRGIHLADDALGSAKVALIGIDRSEAALTELRRDDVDARVDRLLALLRGKRSTNPVLSAARG